METKTIRPVVPEEKTGNFSTQCLWGDGNGFSPDTLWERS